jgi:hypothetical protein
MKRPAVYCSVAFSVVQEDVAGAVGDDAVDDAETVADVTEAVGCPHAATETRTKPVSTAAIAGLPDDLFRTCRILSRERRSDWPFRAPLLRKSVFIYAPRK